MTEAQPALAPDAPWWASPPAAAPSGPVRTSQYVTMPDGVRLAVDVYLPRILAAGGLPAILWQTRYFRRLRYQWWAQGLGSLLGQAPDINRFVAAGYAFVGVDIRGTGASFGSRTTDMSDAELDDGRHLCDWITAQPWSDGRIGATGVSYDGTAAEHLMRHGHPAVRAAIIRFSVFDGYEDIMCPGGVYNRAFFRMWDAICTSKDRNVEESWLEDVGQGPYRMISSMTSGVAPVDGDDGSLLAAAIDAHAANFLHEPAYASFTHRDSPEAPRDTVSPAQHIDELRASGSAVYSWTGWYDGAYAGAAVKRWAALRDRGCRLILGPWNHGASLRVIPGEPPQLGGFDAAGEMLRFLDRHVRGIEGSEDDAPVHYFTMREGRWKAAQQWPPPGFEPATLHLAPGRSLQAALPVADGADEYAVDMTATSGSTSRWMQANMGWHAIGSADRAEEDRKLLLYDSPPLEDDVEITGHPVVTIHLRCDTSDTMVKAYLEEVTEGGRVLHITEGQLRATHRALGEAPWECFGPWHPHTREADRPLQHEEVVELTFALIPISYLARRGSRLRLALAGADADFFDPVPGDGRTPTWDVHHGPAHPSRLVIPAQRRS